MKEVIEQILKDYSLKHKQINFESVAARGLLADYLAAKLLKHNSGINQSISYNDDVDTCCGGNCGCV